MMKANQNSKIAVLLVNLGTPDLPTKTSVTTFLKVFLADKRVVELPSFFWKIMLRLFILPARAQRVAKAYKAVWHKDSPLREILSQQKLALRQALQKEFNGISVYHAMTYGNPNIVRVLGEIATAGTEHIIVLPLFPQYSATTTAAVFDQIADWMKSQRRIPSISLIQDYHQHPQYIYALGESILQFQRTNGRPEKLLFSFHGIPQAYADKGDPYATRCHITATQVAEQLGLADDQWAISFQSRFGKQQWVTPYTSNILSHWVKSGVKFVQVLSPSFSADCLETLEEIAIGLHEEFIDAGGRKLQYIPALNAGDKHIDMMVQLVAPYILAHQQQSI